MRSNSCCSKCGEPFPWEKKREFYAKLESRLEIRIVEYRIDLFSSGKCSLTGYKDSGCKVFYEGNTVQFKVEFPELFED